MGGTSSTHRNVNILGNLGGRKLWRMEKFNMKLILQKQAGVRAGLIWLF
jgi:hypothetical protein